METISIRIDSEVLRSIERIYEMADEINSESGASFDSETFQDLGVMRGLIMHIQEQLDQASTKGEGDE